MCTQYYTEEMEGSRYLTVSRPALQLYPIEGKHWMEYACSPVDELNCSARGLVHQPQTAPAVTQARKSDPIILHLKTREACEYII
jgi:hypothetical protein